MKIWERKLPGTLWATPGLLRDCFTLVLGSATQSELLTVPLRKAYNINDVNKWNQPIGQQNK